MVRTSITYKNVHTINKRIDKNKETSKYTYCFEAFLSWLMTACYVMMRYVRLAKDMLCYVLLSYVVLYVVLGESNTIIALGTLKFKRSTQLISSSTGRDR